LAVALLCNVVSGCSPNIPEADTPAARLYVNRCGGCHMLHAPGSMTAAMWDMQVERMQGELVRRGIAPLTKDERQTLIDYLHRHSAGVQVNNEDH
jgi:hypothetical protein